MGLRSKCPFGNSLYNLSGEGRVFLGVDELLTPRELEFSIFLDKIEGVDGLVDVLDAVDGRAYIGSLRRGQGSSSET